MRDEDRRMVYLTDAAIPSREANSIQTMKMCEAFAQDGFEVTLVIPDRPTEETGNPYEFYDVSDCFDIVRVPWKPGGRYLYSLLAPHYVRRIEPDVVYGRFVPACFFTAFGGYQVVVESHSPVSESQWVMEWMFRFLLLTGRLKHIVVISEALKDQYLSTYDSLEESKVTVAHDAASDPGDVESFSFADSERLQVGYIGHLYEGKGMSVIAKLVEECSWADFHVVGGTPTDIQQWEESLRENDNVVFHGFVPPAEVVRYQQSMDVMLAPYQRHVSGGGDVTNLSRWMSPLKIFEYMAAGKPIICSDLPVLREVLTDRNTALLCNPDNHSEWVKALSILSENSEMAERIGRNARAKFLQEHTYSQRSCTIVNGLL